MAYWIEQVLNGLGLVGPTLLIAVSLTVMLQAVGALNVAVGATIVLAALVGIEASHAAGAAGLVIGCVVSGIVFVALTELAVLGPQRRRRMHDVGMSSFAATLGVSIAMTAVAAIVTNSGVYTMPTDLFRFNSVFTVDGVQVVGLSLGIFGLAAATTIGWELFQRFTSTGKLFRALASNRDLALASGMRIGRVALQSAILSGAMVGLATFLVLLQTRSVSFESGADYLITPFVAVVLGGLGNMRGAVVAAVGLGVGQSLLSTQIGDPNVQQAIIFGTLFVALLVRPTGFAGAIAGAREY